MEELEKENEMKSKKLKVDREREEEEYNYKTKRERTIENNNWEDEKIKRESELAKKEAETSKLLDEAVANAEHIKELEQKVEEIPALVDRKSVV